LRAVGDRGVYTGNPVLPEIATFDRAALRPAGYERFGLDPARLTVLVFGGSLGARTLNEAAPGLARRWAQRADLQVLHLSGRGPQGQVAGDGEHAASYHRVEYTNAMAEVYAVADIGICRGGATTVAELAAVSLPSVIVPYPHHRDRQQERHAEVLATAGAARIVPDPEATVGRLGEVVEGLLTDDTLARMADAAHRLGRPDAAQRLVAVVEGVA
jgi:UDP-N-acetylglucosamine--N-acetylmuramyl-(pentapeptide) pyrophosphoryl-undecaprenol N-acetylglucosamine transferase